MKPIIGITVNYDFRETIGDVTGLGTPLQDWDYIALDSANAVEMAGDIPVLIPNCKDTETMRPFIGKIDGLLLSGGSDVDPEIYGGAPLLGVPGAVIITHGSSSHKAIYYAVKAGVAAATNDVTGLIQKAVAEHVEEQKQK